ncbi:MAG: PD-(D/E)XK nuclease family protein [Rhodocyclaceae bacterium]|nr:PD-(D/E)XK nuclease family protein [Rhodocyclaceae bacterium]MEB2318035.1 PD-(D/E)XK nuclease family protein [Pseudomonadota bacterium]
MARPNLFEYATSELSQDAVLCWLAAWAAPGAAAEDGHLHVLGLKFIAALMEVSGRPMLDICSLEIRRQYKSIDVLIIINSRLAICIEDKVGSTEHSEQLERYVEGLKADGFPPKDIVPVYVQTFEQSTYAAVKAAGYAPVSRKRLLAILEPYAKTPGADAIARDFHDRLAQVDREVESFRYQPPSQWTWLAWQGFYGELQAKFLDGEWGYVANQAGGFQGFWWHFQEGSGCKQYLQLEEAAVCFKIQVDRPESRAELRDRWHARLIEQGRKRDLNVVKPRRFGLGETMTVAVLETDYRVTDQKGLLDFGATVARLREAEVVLDEAAASVA